jgi:hypothetical protein
MSPLPAQRTRLEGLLGRLGRSLLGQLRSSWRGGSLALLALLIGFFAAQNFTSLWMQRLPGGRPVVVLLLVLVIETVVRLRSRWLRQEPPLAWVIADNLRIGFTYSIVYEAFKLGS